MVSAVLERSGFPPSKLEIEVTETALVGNLEPAHLLDLGLVGLITDQFLALLGRYLFPWETGQTGLARALRAVRRALPLRARLART